MRRKIVLTNAKDFSSTVNKICTEHFNGYLKGRKERERNRQTDRQTDRLIDR
jgi:hypothetical protein